MLDSKSPIVKIGGYILIGFFTLIIIISFGMPDFISRLGMNQNVVAVVNGEKIHRLDFFRYMERFTHLMKNSNKKEMQKILLDNLILNRLMLQKATSLGIKVSDQRVIKSMKNISAFQDKSGKFDNDLLNKYLNYYNLSLTDFYSMIKEELIINELRQMIDMGIGVPPDDVIIEHAIDKSKVQIKYCFASNNALKKRFRSKIAVNANEIDKELEKDKDEIKDPKTDRKRIKKKLEKRKFENIKMEIVNKINSWAREGKSFSIAASYLASKVYVSNVFKIGDPVREKNSKGKQIFPIINSQVFREDCLSIKKGNTSRAINSFDGIYIFSPIKKNIIFEQPSQSDFNLITQRLVRERSNSVFMSMMHSLREKSKITKNLKID